MPSSSRLTWVERQTIIINAGSIRTSAIDIADDPDEYRLAQDIFEEGLLQTIFHESRHLFYECNELVEIGEGTEYPALGGLEENVEDYGNGMSDKYLNEFFRCINHEVLDKFIESEIESDTKNVQAWKPNANKVSDYEKENSKAEKNINKNKDFDISF